MTIVKLATGNDHRQLHVHNSGTDTDQVIFTYMCACVRACSSHALESVQKLKEKHQQLVSVCL